MEGDRNGGSGGEEPSDGADLFRRLIEYSTDLIAVTDEEGIITFLSPSHSSILGYDTETLLGETVIEQVHPDDVSRVKEKFDQLLDGTESMTATEYRFRTADEEWRWLETKGQNRLDDPVIQGIVLVSRDVTERKERERALETLHDRTRALITADSREAIAELTADAANDVLGYPITVVRLLSEDGTSLDPVAVTEGAKEILGERPSYPVGEGTAGRVFLTGEADVYEDLRTVDDAYNRGDALSGLFVPIGSFGVLAIGETEVGALSEEDVQLARILAANAEVAFDRLEREQELHRQNERLDQFASVISHDLRGPLNVATGRLDLLEDDPERIEPIRDALDRMWNLIEDVLTLARQGRTVDETVSLELETIVEQCWTNLDTDTATLEVETTKTVEADPARLPQIFENLFRNAIEHGSTGSQAENGTAAGRGGDGDGGSMEQTNGGADGKSVTIRVGDRPNGFYVADDGPGIPPDIRADVFEAGFTTETSGTGLGLAIVQEIAEAHGWSVSVSDSEMSGARFDFTGVRTDEE